MRISKYLVHVKRADCNARISASVQASTQKTNAGGGTVYHFIGTMYRKKLLLLVEGAGAQFSPTVQSDLTRLFSHFAFVLGNAIVLIATEKSRGVREDMRDAGGMLDPSPPVRPILKTATKTGTRTRFIADSDRKYQSYSQSFHCTNYNSRTTSSASSTPAGGRPGPSSVTISSSRGSHRSSAEMAPLMSAAAVAARSSRERKRSDEVFVTPASDRRVTFSPFTKIKHTPRPRRSVNAQDPQKMASGFVFASGTEMEKRKQAKKKQELQMMEKLYFASRKRSIGWKDMLLENFTILKRVQDWSTRWMDLFNSSSLSALLRKKNAQMLRRQKTRRIIRARREAPQWTEFDQADHEYMKQLTLPASSTESTVNNAIVPNGKHAEFISEKQDPVPDLTPLKQGSFSNLLRKEGIPVDEDEQREKLAMVDDLRGVGHASIRLKVSRH